MRVIDIAAVAMNYASLSVPENADTDSLRLEAVTACVGFDDLLDFTLSANHPHVDTMIIVTSHDDKATHAVARKHGAICVQTDLFHKNGRRFNKGAALNAALARCQYYGWRLHLDADIVLPDNFRRVLFNHTHLEKSCLYGMDRVDVVGRECFHELRKRLAGQPQAQWGCFIHPQHDAPISPRYMDNLRGYVPIGFFQLWHAAADKSYPHSLGSAAHDDVMFAEQWAAQHRRLLPTGVCYHLCARKPSLGENWDGKRRQPRF